MHTGVYQIRNLTNGKVYIGSTTCKTGFVGRWNVHKSCLKNNKHDNIHLQRAWNKHGGEQFQFEVLERCAPERCIEREQYYLNAILFADNQDDRFFQLGYNLRRVAGNQNIPAEDITRQRMSENHADVTGEKNPRAKLKEAQVRQIIQLLHQGEFSQRQIARQFNTSQKTIYNIKHQKSWRCVNGV